jgi:ferredoxin
MTRSRIQVRFEPSGITIELEAGERLLDAADERTESAGRVVLLPLACRAGNCGACLLSVRAGADLFAAPLPAEQAALRELGAAGDQRLGCQLHARVDLDEPFSASALVEVVRR